MRYDTVILGAGAAGMMCAAHAPERVLVVDHAKSPGEKIRISGGGRCNFTNLHCSADAFLSGNPHFAKSALARYTQWDFIDLMDRHQIAWHEKTLGQLFCDESAKQIIAMLVQMITDNNADLWLNTKVDQVSQSEHGFELQITTPKGQQKITACNLVLATGGKSIPKMGATGLAYDLARQFGLPVTETRPGLVPLTFPDRRFAEISGVSTPATISAGSAAFNESMLFTHRGLSGPAILQASSYWREGQNILVNLDPENAIPNALKEQRQKAGRVNFTTALAYHLPARLVDHLGHLHDLSGNLADWSDARLETFMSALREWSLTPNGSEGYRTAEVTLGGIDTDALSSSTMEAKSVPGLYVIGEAVDVTGWLGGYNFQWAWSSGMAAARGISGKST